MPSITYPLDLTGANPSNLVTDELHEFSVPQDRIFVLGAGPFYTEGLQIRSQPTNTLLAPGTQYKALWLNKDAVMASGKEVCAVIYVTDPTIASVAITYQAVGGEYTTTVDAIQQVLDALSLPDANQVAWGQIVGTPAQFAPVDHLHHSRDLFGMDEVNAQLEAVRLALVAGDTGTLNALYQFINSRVQDAIDVANLKVDSAGVTNAIAVHKAEASAHTKAQVGLGNVENYPVSTQVQAFAGNSNVYLIAARAADAVAGALRSVGNDLQDPNTTTKPLCLARSANCPTGNDGVLAGDTFLVLTFFNVATAGQLNSTAAARYQVAFALFNNTSQISGIYKRTYTAPAWSAWTDNGGVKYLTTQNLNNVTDAGKYYQLNVPGSSATYAVSNFKARNYPVLDILGTPTYGWIGELSVEKYVGQDIIVQRLVSSKFGFGSNNIEGVPLTWTRYRINGVWDAEWQSSGILETANYREAFAGVTDLKQMTPFLSTVNMAAQACLLNANMKMEIPPTPNDRYTSVDSGFAVISALNRTAYSGDYVDNNDVCPLLLYKVSRIGRFKDDAFVNEWNKMNIRPALLSGATNGNVDLRTAKCLGINRFTGSRASKDLNRYAQWYTVSNSRVVPTVGAANSYLGKITIDLSTNNLYTADVQASNENILRFAGAVGLFNIAVDKKHRIAMAVITDYNTSTNILNATGAVNVMFSEDGSLLNSGFGMPKSAYGVPYTNIYYRNNAILRATEPPGTLPTSGMYAINDEVNPTSPLFPVYTQGLSGLGQVMQVCSAYDGMGIARRNGFHTFHVELDTAAVASGSNAGVQTTWPIKRVYEYFVDLTTAGYEVRWMDMMSYGSTRWVAIGCTDGRVRIFRKQSADATYTLLQTVELPIGTDNRAVIRVAFIAGGIMAFQRQGTAEFTEPGIMAGTKYVLGNIYKFAFDPVKIPSDPHIPFIHLAKENAYEDVTYGPNSPENHNWISYHESEYWASMSEYKYLADQPSGGGQSYKMNSAIYRGNLVVSPAGWDEG